MHKLFVSLPMDGLSEEDLTTQERASALYKVVLTNGKSMTGRRMYMPRPIDADALLKEIGELKKSPWYNGENGNYERIVRADAIGVVVDLCIKDAPTLDYAPVRHGEWVLKHVGYGHYWECSECHTNPCIYVTENTKFCPNCGALMDGKEDV